jgi:hypothetical protein
MGLKMIGNLPYSHSMLDLGIASGASESIQSLTLEPC